MLGVEEMNIGKKLRIKDGKKAGKEVEDTFKKAVVMVREQRDGLKKYTKVVDGTLNSGVLEYDRINVGLWTVVEVATEYLYQGGVVLTDGENTIALPGVRIDELKGLKIKERDPVKTLIAVKEHLSRFPVNAITYPSAINSNPVEVGFNEDGDLVIKAGELEKRIPVSKVVIKDNTVVTGVDNNNRVIYEIPYFEAVAGRHDFKYELLVRSVVEGMYPLFKAIKNGNVTVEVENQRVFVDKKFKWGCSGFSTSGGTLLCSTESVKYKKYVAYPDISAVWNDKEVVGVIVNGYYRKAVEGELVEGLRGWFVRDDRVRPFSLKISGRLELER